MFGQILEVIAVTKKGNINLRNEQSKAIYQLAKNFGHIAHAHCITSYASQGKTVDEVFISQPASTFPATDMKQFYVSVSRGRERCRIYTDDKEALLSHASELGERQSAFEVVARKKTQKDFVMQKEREKDAIRSKEKKSIIKYQKNYEPEI